MNPDNPLHRYMLVLNATFVGPNGQAGFKTVNSVVSRSKKTLPLQFIRKAQDAVVMQLQMFGIEPEKIVDVSFMNASYLGLMTEKEFTEGLPKDLQGSMTLDETNGATHANPFKLQS